MKQDCRYAVLMAVISSADLLRKQGKYDEALQTLRQVDMGRVGGVWQGNLLSAHAEILASQGKIAEAIAKLTEALAVKDMPVPQKDRYEKRLIELQSGAK